MERSPSPGRTAILCDGVCGFRHVDRSAPSCAVPLPARVHPRLCAIGPCVSVLYDASARRLHLPSSSADVLRWNHGAGNRTRILSLTVHSASLLRFPTYGKCRRNGTFRMDAACGIVSAPLRNRRIAFGCGAIAAGRPLCGTFRSGGDISPSCARRTTAGMSARVSLPRRIPSVRRRLGSHMHAIPFVRNTSRCGLAHLCEPIRRPVRPTPFRFPLASIPACAP